MPQKQCNVEGFSTVENWKSRVGALWALNGEYRIKRFIAYLDDSGSEFAGYTPDMLIEYQKNRSKREDFEEYAILDVIQSWVNSMDHLRAESKKGYYKAIKSFFMHNRAILPKDPSFNIRSNVAPVKSELTFEVVRNVILASKPRYQAIFTIMVQSGLDLESFIHWNETGYDSLMKQLQSKKNGEPIRIELPGRKNSKNIENFYTFFGGDAIDKLVQYLKIRGNEKGRIFNTSKHAMRQYWTRQLKRLGYIEAKNNNYKGNRYGMNLHKLRQVFKSRWRLSGVDNELAEFFLGHTIDALGYDRSPWLDPEWYMDKYLEAESWLNILSEDPLNVPRREASALRRELMETKQSLEKIRKQSLVDMASMQGLPPHAIADIQRILDHAETVEDGLRQIARSGISILHSPEAGRNLRRQHNIRHDEIIVEGNGMLSQHLSNGFSFVEELSLEGPKNTVLDEVWTLSNGDTIGEGEKIFASIHKNGTVDLRGCPQDLDELVKNLAELGIEITEKKLPRRFKLRQP